MTTYSMRRVIALVAVTVVLVAGASVAIRLFHSAPAAADSSSADAGHAPSVRKILYYWDPMLGPSSISNKPGKSAMGMDLVPVYGDGQSNGPSVKIDPAIVQNMGIRTTLVKRGSLQQTVRTVGTLEVPDSGQIEVNLRVNGWIQKLYANENGMSVKKGQPLFDLYSPDVQVAGEELIAAVKDLSNLDSSSPAAVRADAQRLVDSGRRKLRLWGIADEDIQAIATATSVPETVPFRSPMDGHVEEKAIVDGSAVQAGMKLMRIEDHSSLWLDLAVYEQQLPLVFVGEAVQATLEAVPGRTFTGKISFIYPHLDHMTRTATARVVLDNPNHILWPGEYVTASIITMPIPDAIVVPREAVIDTGTRQIAFVVSPDGHFDPRNVRMGIVGDADCVQILDGLSPGETVVTSGQFLLDVESRTNEAIDKLRNSPPVAMPTPDPREK